MEDEDRVSSERRPIRVCVLAPVYNDWDSFTQLLAEIDAQAQSIAAEISVVAVDDGSTQDVPSGFAFANLTSVSVAHLACNLGHQRAIAIGLAHIHRIAACDAVIVMDSDGEDRPAELAAFIAIHRTSPDAIVVGQRAQRSEGVTFRGFYTVYKLAFGAVTGRQIDFGNFCLVPMKHVARIICMPELWNHLAATVLRSKLPIIRIRTRRGTRHAGRSSMNFISLAVHGLSAMAAFGDVLFVRLLLASIVIIALGALGAATAIVMRMFTGLTIPGWTTTAAGVGIVVVLQGLVLSITAAFMTLGNRTNLQFVPMMNGPAFIREIREYSRRAG